MITFICDNCEKALEVDDNQASLKVKCPYCGDVNIVPKGAGGSASRTAASSAGAGGAASALPSARGDRAEAAGLPSASGPEAPVATVKSAMFRSKPFATLFMLILIFGGAIGGLVLAFMPGGQPAAIGCGVAFAVGLLWLGIWKLAAMEVRLEITTKRTIERKGILSKETTEVMHADIRNFQLTQTFWQRILNVGTIAISSAANHEVEIEMKHVPRPNEVRKMIDVYRPI